MHSVYHLVLTGISPQTVMLWPQFLNIRIIQKLLKMQLLMFLKQVLMIFNFQQHIKIFLQCLCDKCCELVYEVVIESVICRDGY